MAQPLFNRGEIYQGPDAPSYTPVLQGEGHHWILGEVVKRGTAWHFYRTVRPNGLSDRRCLFITAAAHGYTLTSVDVRSTAHLLYLDEVAQTHFTLTTSDLACLTYLEQAAVAEEEE